MSTLVTVGEVLLMLVCVPDVLSKDDVADFRRIMDAADWEDGRSTAGRAIGAGQEQRAACRRTARSRASSAIAWYRR